MCSWIVVMVQIVVMFWNVENCFDSFDNPLKYDEDFTPYGEKHWTWKRFESKRDGIAKTIIAASQAFDDSPSVIGLAEVENALVVHQLADRSPLSIYSDYGFVHRESPDERGIDVALLYRKDSFRVLDADSLRIDGFATRDILYVKGVTIPERDTFHFFVNHWPSKLGGKEETDHRRKAAANVLSCRIDSLVKTGTDPKIIVMGDFNDETVPLRSLLTATDRSEGSRETLVHIPAASSNKSVSGTLKYHGRWETIDHFFTSANIAGTGSALIFSPLFLLETDKQYLGLKPRRTYIGPRYNCGISDHLPIILQIGRDR